MASWRGARKKVGRAYTLLWKPYVPEEYCIIVLFNHLKYFLSRHTYLSFGISTQLHDLPYL